MVAVALLLVFTGPWLVYLIVPVPDQLAEYRNYSMVAGFALLASLLPWLAWTPMLAYFLGMAHVHAMSWTDQITFWRKAKDSGSGDKSRATQEIGAFLKIGGKLQESEPYFLEAIRLNPNLAPAMENLANVYFMTDRKDECYAMVDTLVSRCPRYASGWQTRGIFMEMRNNEQEAIQSFEVACSLSKDMPQSANHLGLIAFRQGRFADALKWFKKAGQYHADEPTFQYNEAMALYGLGRTEEADAIKNRFNGVPLQWNPEMAQPQQKTA